MIAKHLLGAGVCGRETSEEAELALWVYAKPRTFQMVRNDVVRSARDAGLEREWTIDTSAWEFLRTAVDEQIYRELPCFIVATVDKFAMLPWRGETGMLFGRVAARSGKEFFGPMDKPPKGATLTPAGLLPPELVVQDELHLISGPLGTMVGLYETAIEWLSSRRDGDRVVRPKILASTATVRRARQQIRSLFGRPGMSLFPPPGVDAAETYFATLHGASGDRLYVGVAAPGRPLKAILLRTYVALLGAAQARFDPRGPADQPADAYMTLAGYFNSLRELGGMRRLVEDDVHKR